MKVGGHHHAPAALLAPTLADADGNEVFLGLRDVLSRYEQILPNRNLIAGPSTL